MEWLGTTSGVWATKEVSFDLGWLVIEKQRRMEFYAERTEGQSPGEGPHWSALKSAKQTSIAGV